MSKKYIQENQFKEIIKNIKKRLEHLKLIMQKQESKINILQIKQKKVIMSIKTAQIKYQNE